MKRYLLFSGDHYHPEGGWFDLLGSFDRLEDAVLASPSGADWFHIVDTTTGTIVWPTEKEKK